MEINIELVRGLIAARMPKWASLLIVAVEPFFQTLWKLWKLWKVIVETSGQKWTTGDNRIAVTVFND